MRTRDEIEADLEILTWPHVVLDAAVVYDRLLRDVEPLLAALAVAEAAREAATSRANRHRQTGDEWMLRATAAEAALACVESACVEMLRGADEAEARMPGQVSWVVNATRECVAGVREALAAPTPEPPSDLAQNVVPALVESIQWAVKQIDAALVDTRMSAAAMSWLRTIREGLLNSSGAMPEHPPNALADLIFGNDAAPVSEQPKEQQ